MARIEEEEIYDDNDVIERWEDLKLRDELIKGIYAAGFENPSFIQKRAIRPLINGKDLRAQSQSGTGKTGAFCIAALQKINLAGGVQVIILAPTREIALQNYTCLTVFGRLMTEINIKLLQGGKSVKQDIEDLESSPHIIVGTPGRVLHMLKDNHIRLSESILFIIDEADELFKRGFKDTIKEIYVGIKDVGIQVAMFSATWESDELETSLLLLKNDPKVIDLRKDEQTLKGIDQYLIDMGERRSNKGINDELKIRIILDIYSRYPINQSIIFVNTVDRVKAIHNKLNDLGFVCGAIHSDLTQTEREDVFKRFKSGDLRTLISTDIAGRGVDVQQLSVVINFDLPRNNLSSYIHRIGRAGRYGKKGSAINLIFQDEASYIKEICEHYRTSIVPFTDDAHLK